MNKAKRNLMESSQLKGFFFVVMTVLATASFGQVGIGTVSPAGGSQLDVTGSDKGMLVPRVDIDDLSDIDPVTGGSTESLLVYNTNTTTGKGFHYWDGTEWVKIKDGNDGNSSSGDYVSLKYTTNSDSQNLSTGSFTPIELFTTLAWNDDTSIFNVTNNRTLQIREAGRYRITANLGMLMDDDVGLEVRISIAGSDVGAAYIASRVDNDDTPRSLYISEVFQVGANNLVRIRGRRTSDSGSTKDIFLVTDSDSYIEVVKLD